MNLKKFKEIVKERDISLENFKLFRVWAENSYEIYLKEYLLAYEERIGCFQLEEVDMESEDIRFVLEWSYIGYEAATELFKRMGWELSENLKNKKVLFDSENDIYYYNVILPEVYSYIKNIEDDIEFAYAVLTVCINIYKNTKLYKVYVKDVFEGLKEYEIYECLELLDDKSEKKFLLQCGLGMKLKLHEKVLKKH